MATRNTEPRAARPVSGDAVDQGLVITFLGEGRAFGFPDQQVERIDTHAAIVFLISDRAYKLKRAVRYSFLDFSRVEQRHRVLETEYRLNVRTAPDLYRRVVPVTCDDSGHLALGGEGRTIDWLLEMKRFDQRALLDNLAEEGRLDAALIGRLALEIADLHQKAEVRPGGRLADMASIVDGNTKDLASLAGTLDQNEAIMSLIDATRAELSHQSDHIDRRADAGFVRHCHGDLHLGNIFLDGEQPVLFDCLEFDEALATIDVFYDLAFLLMDLCHRNLDDLAIDLLNAYLDRSEDDEGTALLPLFLAIRATIRVKIEGFEIETAKSNDERVQHRLAAIRYLDLARDLLATEPPRLVAIGGLSGTGKSTVARLLAHALGRACWPVVLRSDIVRKRLLGVEPTMRLYSVAYSSSCSAQVYQRLLDRAGALLRAGRTVIVDATFLDPRDRLSMERLAKDFTVPFQGIWLDAPRRVLEQRIRTRHGDASDADVNVLAKQCERDLGGMTWTVIDASGGANNIALDIHARALEQA